MSVRSALLIGFILAACGPLTPPQPDGGAGGGATGGGGAATGGGTATGGGGGVSVFSWVSMSLSPVPGIPSTNRVVVGLAHRPNGETWAALGDGTVYRAAAGSNLLQLVPGFPAPTGTTEHADLATTDDGEVLLLRGRSVFRCTNACANFTDFTSVFTVPSLESPESFCVRGNRVLFTSSTLGGPTALYESQRTGAALTFASVTTDLGVSGERCFITETGDVLVPSSSSVAVYLQGGGFTTQAVDLQGQLGARWISVARSATSGLMVGGGSGMRVAQRVGNGWQSQPPNSTGPILNVALMLSATEFLAAGDTSGDPAGQPSVFTFDGNTLSALTPAPPATDVHRGAVVGPNEVLLGGASRSGSTYVILHGTR